MIKNRDLEQIEDEKIETLVNKTLTETSNYLMNIASPENKKVIQERLPHIDAVIISLDEKTAYRKVNGEFEEFEIPDTAAAITTAGKMEEEGSRIYADYYIYLRKGISEHAIKHEEMHALSSAREATRIDDKIHTIKRGLYRSYELTSGKDLLNSETIYTDGMYMTEGMTEYLTNLSEGKGIEFYNYLENILLIQFLVGGNIENENNLIQTYLADTVGDIESFENEFNSYMKEEGIKYEDYSQFEGDEDIGTYIKLLKGAITYRIKSAKTIDERNNEINFYKKSITNMNRDRNLNNAFFYTYQKYFRAISPELRDHLKAETTKSNKNNIFSITTQNIGKATITSPTELKKEVENIETIQTTIEEEFKNKSKNKGIEYND